MVNWYTHAFVTCNITNITSWILCTLSLKYTDIQSSYINEKCSYIVVTLQIIWVLVILSLYFQNDDTALHFAALHNNDDIVVAICNCTVHIDVQNRVSININYILITALVHDT